MTDEQLDTIYFKVTGTHIAQVPEGYVRIREFISRVFSELPVAGYLDPDGGFHLEEWEAGADCEEVFRRPE